MRYLAILLLWSAVSFAETIEVRDDDPSQVMTFSGKTALCYSVDGYLFFKNEYSEKDTINFKDLSDMLPDVDPVGTPTRAPWNTYSGQYWYYDRNADSDTVHVKIEKEITNLVVSGVRIAKTRLKID